MRLPCPSLVRVTSGDYANRIGFYDSGTTSEAFVYFGEPLMSESVIIPKADLELADPDDPAVQAFQQKYPLLVELIGA